MGWLGYLHVCKKNVVGKKMGQVPIPGPLAGIHGMLLEWTTVVLQSKHEFRPLCGLVNIQTVSSHPPLHILSY